MGNATMAQISGASSADSTVPGCAISGADPRSRGAVSPGLLQEIATLENRDTLHLAPLAGRGRREAPGEGDPPRVALVERAPHPASPSGFAGASPNPPRASFARLDPVKNGARERSADAEPTCTQSTQIMSACNYRFNFQTATPKCLSRHCEPTGRANARPMTGSAKQFI